MGACWQSKPLLFFALACLQRSPPIWRPPHYERPFLPAIPCRPTVDAQHGRRSSAPQPTSSKSCHAARECHLRSLLQRGKELIERLNAHTAISASRLEPIVRGCVDFSSPYLLMEPPTWFPRISD